MQDVILQKIGLYFERCKSRKPKDFQDVKGYCLWSTFSVKNIGNNINEYPLDVYEALKADGHEFYFRDEQTAVVKTLEFIDYEHRLLFMGTDAKWAKVIAQKVS